MEILLLAARVEVLAINYIAPSTVPDTERLSELMLGLPV